VSLDLGDLEDLATAVGLVDADGTPVESWFADPGTHLSRVLANPVQRQALVSFVDDLLGGDDATTDENGVSWLPVVEAGDGAFRLFVTLAETSGGATIRVGVGVRVRVAAGGVECAVDAQVPLFLASGTTSVPDPLLFGKAGAPVDATVRLRLPPATAPGGIALASAELGASVPTAAGEQPALRLALRGLRMPGAAAPRDIVVDAASAAELDHALLELVFGLIAAQVAAMPASSPLRGLAGMLGLADDAVPDFPVADLFARGPIALADWFAAALTGAARQDWMTGLANLFGVTVTGTGDDAAVEVTVAGAPVRLELHVTPGASARPAITPRVSAGITVGAAVRLALSVDLVTIDLGNGAALALPRLAITARLDPPGAAKLLPAVAGPGGLTLSVGALETGFALDANRRPVLVVTAEDADVGTTHYDLLDLSTPQALAAVAASAVADAARALLTALGPAGDAIAILLGLDDAPGAPGLPRIDAGELLRDPVGAVGAHWRGLFATHATSVPALLATLRDAIADARVRATAVGGTGTPADPWRVPLAPSVDLLLTTDGDRMIVGCEAGLGADLAPWIRAALALRASIARFDLAARTAAFLPEVHAGLTLSGPGGAPLSLGTEGLAVSIASLGVDLGWISGTGLRVLPISSGASVQFAGAVGAIELPQLVLGPDGRLALDGSGWTAVQQLAGALALDLARRANLPWLPIIVGLLGWAPRSAQPGVAASGGAELSLATLVADPATAFADFARALVRDEDALRTLLEAFASMLAQNALAGIAADARPWVVPLVPAVGALAEEPSALLPSLIVTFGADGAQRPMTLAPERLTVWTPGDNGFDPDGLVAALFAEGEIDDVLDDMLGGRGDVAQGLIDLVDRWAGTDGLVNLPDDSLPTGVTAHRPSDLARGEALDGAYVSAVLAGIWGGAAPARIVFVAIDGDDRHGAPLVLPTGLPANRVIDLTAAAPPEAFVPPTVDGAAPQVWAIRLGSRATCRLPAGDPAGPDPDGVAGQAARLRRVLAPLAGAGADLAIVAHGGAGHAAVRAVDGLAGIRTVVTVGTPWSPVSVDSLDAIPSGEALRLFAALLRLIDAAAADPGDEAADPGEPDDPDLGLARGVIGALMSLDPFADPLADVRPPGGLAAPAGVPVHAIVGSIAPPALRRALTAVVVASLAARARARAALPASAPAPIRAGLRLPLIVASGELSATILADVDLASVARDEAAALNGPDVRVRLDLGAAKGWLVGGPDPGRGSGGARVLACRRISASVALPIRSWGSPLPAPAAQARLVLHEAAAFGTQRDRWVVEAGTGTTPLLPEVRAILSEVMARIASAAADPAIAAFRAALAALGVAGPDGGLDAITLERLLLDPEPTVDSARSDPVRRGRLAAAIRTMVGDTRAAAVAQDSADLSYGSGELTAHVDLAAPALTVTSSASADAVLAWSIGVTAAPAGMSATLRLGDDVTLGTGAGVGLFVDASAAGLAATLRQRGPGGTSALALWPTPAAGDLLGALTTAVPAFALRALVDALRQTLASGAPPVAAAIDALLDAVGLLAPGTGARALRSPYALMADPAAWLANLPTGIAASVPALLDALRGLLGGAGDAGTLRLADGVRVRAAMSGTRLLLALDVDATAFTPPVGGLQLALAGGIGLSISTSALTASLPDVTASVGIAGVGAMRLRVGPDAGGAGDAVGVTLSLAPASRPEIILLPGGPGLGGLADAIAAGAVAALPALLDAIAGMDPAGAPATPGEFAGRLVARLGDGLGLRSGAPAHFDQAQLVAFGTNPAAALAARAATLSAAALTLLVEAIGPLLGGAATRSVTVVSGALRVEVQPVILRWLPGTSRIEAEVTLSGLPGIASLAAHAALSPAGLALLDVTIGPAQINADVVDLHPFARVVVGSEATTPRIEVGLGVGTERRLAFRWDLAASSAALIAIDHADTATPTESSTPADVASAVAGAVLDLAGAVVLRVQAVRDALALPVLGGSVQSLLENVLIVVDSGQVHFDSRIVGELRNPTALLRRLGTLAGNLADAPNAGVRIADKLLVRIARRTIDGLPVYGLNVAVDGSWELNPGSDVVVSLEEDANWIQPPSGTVPEGVTIDVVAFPDAPAPPVPRPGLLVGGVGVRIARASGPLLDAGVSIGSVAVHLFGSIASAGSSVNLAGGVHLELASLGIALAGAHGGDNTVAQGVMPQSGAGPDAPTPRFSPALALQQHPGQPLRVSITAGPGSGPWWLTIQRQFGPVYLEQVGLAVVNPPAGIESIGILIDGGVSLAGLSASVDDLSLTYLVAGGGSALDPSHWRVDLAGFAVAADISGLSLAGGLRRFSVPEGGVEYLGMLLARLSVYGISVYGGYGVIGPEGDRYTSLFLFGAVNGPIGGPPAFFVTGIGGGLGINRRLTVPTDLSQFGTFPMIKALDPAARPGDPFQELADARAFFAPERGSFWFAAGVSFNSFALVDGIAVIAIQIGGGFELSLLGLARMALPRPEAALVSIELALVARFSTREGIILVQGQLTDNSWLLLPEMRLTGGFAFASWFAGPNRGQFVVTIGGYHPDFHRDGYPSVPRLGIAVRIGSNISIVGESYFALTSEAVMAGTRMEISATLGPAWAHVVYGGDGIVFFDPFHFSIRVYASIDAGVTIDVWIGEITISVHLSASIEVTGPPLHVVAHFEVGPVGLTLEFGQAHDPPREIPWDAFVRKYLEEAAPGRARILAAATGDGAIPPSGSSASGGAQSPDGTPDRPFRVLAEFEMTVTSTAPLRKLDAGSGESTLAASAVISVAPMRLAGAADVKLALHMLGPASEPLDRIARLQAVPQQLGAFPIGTWGVAQDPSNPTVPSGDVIAATDRVMLRAVAEIPGTRPGDPVPPAIPYRQVETGARRILPFVTETASQRAATLAATVQLAALVPPAANAPARLSVASTLLAQRGGRSPADIAAWRADRSAVPLLGSLGEGLGRAPPIAEVAAVAPPPPPAASRPRPPRVRAIMMAPEAREPMVAKAGGQGPASTLASSTTVSQTLRNQVAHVVAPPRSLAEVDAALHPAVPARLLRLPTPAALAGRTVVAALAPPLTRTVQSGGEIGAGRAITPAAAARLAAFDQALVPRAGRTTRAAAPPAVAHVAAGEIAVLELPDAARDADSARRPNLIVRNGRARIVALGPGGGVFVDRVVAAGGADKGTLVVPPATRSLIVIGLPTATDPAPGLPVAGWSADVPLPSASDGVLVGAGCVIDAAGRVAQRGSAPLRAGWASPDRLVSGESAVTTTFAAPVAALAVALEGGTGPDFALGIDGARRPIAADGAPERPLIVADGSRAVLVFRLIDSKPGTTFTVTTGAARRLAGVLAAPPDLSPGLDPVAVLAEAIGRGGLMTLVPPVATPRPGGADLAWKEN
jgi:hypothetical protein